MKKHILQENYERFFGKREFGDPLPTFKGVMEKHQINKLKEDWWDDMSPEDQASYIKKHPGSKQAQDAGGDEPEKITKGPGGYGDRGNVRGGDQRNFGEPDDEEYFKSMMGGDEDDYDMGVVPGSRELDDTPEDDSEKGSSLTSAPGRVPDEKPSGGQPSVDDSRRKAVQSGMALKKAEGEFGKDSPEYEAAKGADDEAHGEYQQAKASQEQRQKDINSGNVEPETKEEADLAVADARDSVEKQKKNRAYALQQPDIRDPRSPAEQEAGWNQTVADAEERAEEAEAKAKEFGSSRTGTELNQETLTIDGKQFRRISEGVEKQPKPKYEFSEFYQRFKR